MITVSDGAAALLYEISVGGEASEAGTLRLVQQGDNLGMDRSPKEESDQVIEFNEKTVMLIEEQVSENFDGATIETEETPEGPRLTMVSPKEGE